MNQQGRMGRWLSLMVIAGLLGACAGGNEPGAPGAAVESQRYEWKLITTWPKNLPALGTAPEKFAKLVERMSNGRLKIKVYGAGELVGAFAMSISFSSISNKSLIFGVSLLFIFSSLRCLSCVARQ